MEADAIIYNDAEKKPKKAVRKPKLPNWCVKVRYTKESVRNGTIEVVSIGYAKMMEKRGMLTVIE